MKGNCKLKNLQIGYSDLFGNKFNGHDLHLYLNENDIDSSHLVWKKESDDANTFEICDSGLRRSYIGNLLSLEKSYNIQSLLYPYIFDILYNRLFLEADIIHLHLIHANFFNIQMLPILTSIKPTVWSLHDPWPLSGHCVHHYNCCQWQTHCHDCPKLNTPLELSKDNTALNFMIKKHAVQNSQIDIIVSSKWLFDKVIQSPIFKNKKIHLIPFGINQEIFKPIDKQRVRQKLSIPNDAFVLFCRYEDENEYKGKDYIDHVINNILTDRQLYIITAGFGQIKTSNKYKVINYNWINNDYLLVDLYNSADLFLMPSKQETFGMMAIEAMSCGVLPIVTNGTSLKDVINAPECGVSTAANYYEYTEVVQQYINNDNERINRANKCLEFARSNYNKNIYVDRIINVYSKVISNHYFSNEADIVLRELEKNMIQQPTSLKETVETMKKKEGFFIKNKLSFKNAYNIIKKLY